MIGNINLVKKAENLVKVCKFCLVEVVTHTTTEKEKHLDIESLTRNIKERKVFTREEITGSHCPKCFLHNGFIMVTPDKVKKFKR